MDSNGKQLTARIAVRCSPELHGMLAEKASRSEMSIADYTRQALLDRFALDEVREALMETER